MADPCYHESDFGAFREAIDSIQETLRDVKDLLISNASLEEQVARFHNELNNHTERLQRLEIDNALAKGSAKWSDKIVWSLAAAGLGTLLGTKLSRLLGG